MNLKNLQKHWDAFGKENPLWAVLTSTKQWKLDEFFETGIQEINEVMDYASTLPASFSKRRALDFGCGVGRLTQALACHFDEVYGVDISPSMIEAARQHNRYGGRCQYHLNVADNLNLFSDDYFDFIYTNIVLQHIAPQYTKNYIAEFVRVLAPGGVLIFQLPSTLIDGNSLKKGLRSWVPKPLLLLYRDVKNSWIDRLRRQPRMEMHGIEKSETLHLVESLNARTIAVKLDRRPTANSSWECYLYSVTKG